MHLVFDLRRSAGRICLGFVATSLLLAAWGDLAGAAPRGRQSRARSKPTQQELYGVSWHRSVEGALQAAAAESPGKPVFWMRMLGELGGFS